MTGPLARVALTGLAALTAVTAATTLAVTEFQAAQAAPAAPEVEPYVLYYTVPASYQGKPETLWTIAARFLGDAERAGEILELNTGRRQPDGGRLTDPGRLNEGWHLVLPWDAIGTGLRHGVLPSTATPNPPTAANPGGAPGQGEVAGVPARPQPGAGRPAGSGSPVSDRSRCRPTIVDAPPTNSSWGQRLVAPERVWRITSGAGVRVAVIDSGVAAGRPELGDRLGRGADIVSGNGLGDTDCVGSGTALAGIIAADDGAGGERVGVAPKAVIIPVRLVDRGVAASPPAAVTAIQVAVATGAKVILLGASVDVTDRTVRSAVEEAIGRGVLVVAPAPAGDSTVAPAEGLLRVGGLGPDQRPTSDYPDGSVDLLAPAVGVRSIGAAGTGSYVGTGTEYAAAFVAGAAALVRSAHPGLSGGDVGRQLINTAAREADAGQESVGRLDPYAAVTRPQAGGLPGTVGQRSGRSQPVSWPVVLAVLAAIGTLLVAGWLWGRYRAARARRRLTVERADDPFASRPDDADHLVRSGQP
ncbi:S8 family serine peptidase [Solwaraspora sp. WMMD1047]|uniref:S8 family serine peptidase n=1 Tax=Solwaraspora sp. WMMD1047 TaxID=3016102 RepID=UPI002417AFDF|nr:S8 family serine peptidase [Solwaraspora sp. WMMD1047]MDG4833915.1 S8 family serine peptidase [Solwaraspora sp. WMMD1047]